MATRYGYRPPEERDEEPEDFVRVPGWRPEEAQAQEVPEEDFGAQLAALSPPAGAPGYSRAKSFDMARRSDNQAQIGSDLSNNIYNAFTGRAVQGKPLASSVGASNASAQAFDLDEENNPTSASAQMTRDLIKKALPEVAAQMGPQFERLTTRKAKEFFPFLKENLLEIRGRRAAVTAAEKAKQDRINKLGDDAAQRTWQEGRDAKSQTAAAERARIMAGQKKDDAAAKTEETNSLLRLNGYRLRPGFSLKPEVAESMRTAQASTDIMKQNLDELMDLYRRHGNAVLPGPARARMSSIARHLQLQAKNKSMFELGVLAGPDLGLLEQTIPNPASGDATIADFFGGGENGGESLERLRVMREQVDKRFASGVWARGYEPDAEGGGRQGGGFDAGAPVIGKSGRKLFQNADGNWEVEE